MSLFVSDFIDGRIEDTAQKLRDTNGEYAVAVKKRRQLYEDIDPIIMSDSEELTISHGDCLNFKDYMDEDFTATALMQQALYKQGCRDCVELLKLLGVLA